MMISTDENGSFMQAQSPLDMLSGQKIQQSNPELEILTRDESTDPEMMKRAMDRADEERDLRVLDAYNKFEAGLQEILTSPQGGVMLRQTGAAQSAVFEINDYFNQEGGKLLDELPDEQCRERFTDILASRRKTAINAVARHQTQEYQKWKEETAARTIDSILTTVSISPDAASLMHGERLLEGTILRLYRSSTPEILTVRLNNAKQAMYSGALESIAANDPVTAIIVLENWKEQLGEENYEELRSRFEPLARAQSLKMEFNSLKDLDGEILKAELEDISDPQMRDELAEMIMAERLRGKYIEERTEIERINNTSRELFQLYTQGQLNTEHIVDSALPPEQRSMWRLIFSSDGAGDDQTLLQVVRLIIDQEIEEEHQIYIAMAKGLGKIDATLLAGLFKLKENPEAKLILNGLQELAEVNEQAEDNEEDHAAAIRDFLNRVAAKVGKGETFSITAVRNEVIHDHFGTKQNSIHSTKDEGLKMEESQQT